MKTSEVLQAVLTLEKYLEKKPMTNADKIRTMSDDELAELLRDTQCNSCAWQGNDCDYADDCKAEKLEMLKRECEA